MSGVDLDSATPPFDLLSPEELAKLRRATDLVYFAKGDQPVRCDEAAPAVYVIYRGRMQAVRPGEGGQPEKLGEYGPGDVLGAFAVMMGKARYTYEALEQTLAHAIDAAAFRAVQQANPTFAAWFLEGLSAKRQRLERDERGETAETMLTRVADAELAPAVVVGPDTTLRETRRQMKAESVSCVLVEEPGQPRGIVTRTDLLDALALSDMPPDASIRPLIRRPLLAVKPDAMLFQALVQMTEHHVERVVVADAERVHGTLGMTEVLSHYSSHSHLIGLTLARATRVEEVRGAALKMTALVRSLHAQGARMGFLTELVSALNGRIMQRLWQLIVPEPFQSRVCLLVMGSEGRREQILKTDQDNALILPDELDDSSLTEVMERFGAELQACGWPPCQGKVMVTNPAWRMRLSAWRAQLSRWAKSTDPRAMLDFAIAIDARPVAGDHALYETLKPHFYEAVRSDVVLHHFAAAALSFSTPLTLFGHLKAGDHGTDIKKGGVFPIVHGLRAMALKHGVPDRNSFRRAIAVAEAGGLSAELSRDVQQSLAVFMRLRLGQQIEAHRRGEAPDNYLRVSELRRLDRELLRDALGVVDSFKGVLKRSFHL